MGRFSKLGLEWWAGPQGERAWFPLTEPRHEPTNLLCLTYFESILK